MTLACLAADKLEEFNASVGKLASAMPPLHAAFDEHSWQNFIQLINLDSLSRNYAFTRTGRSKLARVFTAGLF